MSTMWSRILCATYKGPTLSCSVICWCQAPGCSLTVDFLWPTQSHCSRWPHTLTRNKFCSVYSFERARTHTHTHTHTHTQCSSLRKIMPTQHTFFRVLTAPVFLDLLIVEVSRSHSDTPHSVRLVWTSDQPIAETSTWHHKNTHKRQIHVPGWIRTRIPIKRAAADRRLSLRDHRYRHAVHTGIVNEMQRSWCFVLCALTCVARYVHLREHFLLNCILQLPTALTVTMPAASPPVYLRCIHNSKLIPPLKTVPLPCSYCAPTVVRSCRQHGTIG